MLAAQGAGDGVRPEWRGYPDTDLPKSRRRRLCRPIPLWQELWRVFVYFPARLPRSTWSDAKISAAPASISGGRNIARARGARHQ